MRSHESVSSWRAIASSSDGSRNTVADIHIDDFFKDAAGALTLLYERFPQPLQVFVEDLTGPQEVDEYGLPNRRHMACFATLLWLAEEGFIRYSDTLRQDAIEHATLTGRCFSALIAPSEAVLEDAESELPTYVRLVQGSHIQRIRDALEARDSVAIRCAMVDLLERLMARP